jgi:hypothetical protein
VSVLAGTRGIADAVASEAASAMAATTPALINDLIGISSTAWRGD